MSSPREILADIEDGICRSKEYLYDTQLHILICHGAGQGVEVCSRSYLSTCGLLRGHVVNSAARNDALYGYPRSPEWAARVESIPIGRAGTPEEMGNFIAWLCSKEAEFIVGQCIEIDGGQAT